MLYKSIYIHSNISIIHRLFKNILDFSINKIFIHELKKNYNKNYEFFYFINKYKFIFYSNNYNIHYIIYFFLLFIIYKISLSFLETELSLNSITEHSNLNQFLIFKYCSIWSNHEGSLLLWFIIIFFYKYFFINNNNYYWLNKYIKYTYTYIELIILLCFIINSNIFIKNEILINTNFDLNPVLQDILLLIHPPILYCGYLGTALIFIIGFLNIWFLKFNINFNKNIKILIYLTWIFLSLGIALGSWWAYNELGWGGWWFWDPVENISLIPWLIITILFHYTFIYENFIIHTKNNKWIFFLIIIIFVLNILGTAIIRSGLLNSVHMFISDNTRSLFLFGIFTYLFFINIFIFFFKNNNVFIKINENNIINKDFMLKIIKFLFIISTVILIFGTYGPIFVKKLSVIKSTFFNKIYTPITLTMIFIYNYMILNISLNNIVKLNKLYNYFFYFIFLFLFFYNIININNLYIIYITLIINIISIYNIINIIKNFVNINKKNKTLINLFHILFVFLFNFLIISKNYELNFIKIIKIGDINLFDQYYLYLNDIFISNQKNYNSNYYSFVIENIFTENIINKIFTEKRYYSITEIFTNKNNIFSNMLMDLQIFPNSGNFQEGWVFKINIIPFVLLMWIIIILILLFSVIYIYKLISTNKKLYKIQKNNFYYFKL